MPGPSPLFHHRNKEASAALSAVEVFFQSVAARLRARMVNRSATDLPIRVAGVEIRSLGELGAEPEFRDGSIHGMVRFGANRMPGMVLMQHELLARLIAALLGEDITSASMPSQRRSLTPVEARIANRLCDDLLQAARACWPDSPAPALSFGGLVPSPPVTEAATAAITTYTATLDIGPVDAPLGLMAIAIPLPVLGNIASAGIAEPESAPASAAAKPRRGGLTAVLPVGVDVVVELCRLNLTVNKLRALQAGDVVPLGSLREATVKVNGLPLFEGEAGVSGGQRSVRLTRKLRK